MTHWVKNLIFLPMSFTFIAANADIETSINKDTKLQSWILSDHSLSLELVQRYPSQTTAFFIARDFPEKSAADLAEAGCVFQTIGKNTASGSFPSLNIRLAEWGVITRNKESPVMLKAQWDQQWSKEGVSPPARIAFRWATFPTEQIFKPGDYNWGMTTFGLTPGTHFDLKVVWREDDKIRSALIPDMVCAEDKP